MKMICFVNLVMMLLSCSNMTNVKNTSWSIVKAEGVDTENVSLDFLIVASETDQLLLGSKYTDDDVIGRRFSNYDACIYRSSNSGRNWTKQVFEKGKFTSYTVRDGKIYIAIGINIDNETALFDDSAKVYCSLDKGGSWKEIAAYKDYQIKSIFVASDSVIYTLGIGKNDSSWELRKTTNEGLTWSDEMKLPIEFSTPVFLDRAFWSINESTSQLIRLSLENRRVDRITFPEKDFKPLIVRQNKEELLVAGEKAQTPMVYRYNNGGFEALMQSGDKDKYPVDLFSYGNQLVLMLGKRAGIGVDFYLYWRDLATSAWSAEEMPVNYFKPYSFYNGGFWGYNRGHLYRRIFQ